MDYIVLLLRKEGTTKWKSFDMKEDDCKAVHNMDQI